VALLPVAAQLLPRRDKPDGSMTRDLAASSCSVVAPPGQAGRKQSRVALLLVAAQLLPRRDKPDGSMTRGFAAGSCSVVAPPGQARRKIAQRW
jgi:uncharacterized protein YfaP (DUF2135 family)